MLPIQPQPEPSRFEQDVRVPGKIFLEDTPFPQINDWDGKEYWQKVLPEMRAAYNQICAYCAQWIPHSTGNHSIDHFIPKSLIPKYAYEWSNYRYVSARFNSRKGQQTILDPFMLKDGTFALDLITFLIIPGAHLNGKEQENALQTIKILGLNSDDDLVLERAHYIQEYRKGEISFVHLERRAPFIAAEIKRQKLINE